VVVIPVAPPETLDVMHREVDELVCPLVPERKYSFVP
jgi:predicted phosphoribosyltransferase